MQAARASDAVAFASHVHCPANNPSTLFYLTDQITIELGEQVDEQSLHAIANAAALKIVRLVEGIPNTFVCFVTPSSRKPGQNCQPPDKISKSSRSGTQYFIAILAGVVNFLRHPSPPRTRSGVRNSQMI